ncbi:uncharacterized protein LOC144129739 [Amblyomma americanum]
MANAEDNASAMPGDGPSTAVSVLSLRLPPFSPADLQLWLAHSNSQFTISRITTQAQKFHHVAASLPPVIAAEVRDLLITPPASAPFDTLAAELIKRTTVPEHRRLQQLISSEELGNRKPTQLLRRLQQLLGDKAATFDQAFLREFFLQRSVCLVLVPAQDLSLEKLAELADSVLDVSYSTISLGAVSQPPTPPSSLPSGVDLQSIVTTSTPRSHVSPAKSPHCRPLALFRLPVTRPHLADVVLPHLFKPASVGITAPLVEQRVAAPLPVTSRETSHDTTRSGN